MPNHILPFAGNRCLRCDAEFFVDGGWRGVDCAGEPDAAPAPHRFSEYEQIAQRLCHKAGCKCPIPLLGWSDYLTPRCRLCNVEVGEKP